MLVNKVLIFQQNRVLSIVLCYRRKHIKVDKYCKCTESYRGYYSKNFQENVLDSSFMVTILKPLEHTLDMNID